MPATKLYAPLLRKGNPTWYIEYYIELNGVRKRVRRSKDANGRELNGIFDLKEREAVAKEMMREVRAKISPTAVTPDTTPFLEALQTAVALRASTKAKTNKSFTEVARWVSEYFHKRGWHHLKCIQVKYEHVQAYFDYCVVTLKVRGTTHNTRKNNLRSLFSALVKRGYFPENYVSKVEERPESDPIRRPLSEDEKKIVANAIFQEDKALTLAFVLLGYMAIRPGEIRDLRVGAIDLKRGVVCFSGEFSKNRHRAYVTIPDEAMPYLKSLGLEKYPARYYLFGQAKGRHNKDFSPGSERIGENTLSGRFRELIRRLHREGALQDIKGIQFYSLKDTLATYLIDSGVDVVSAMHHFRHSDLAVFNRYLKRLGTINTDIKALKIDLKLPE